MDNKELFENIKKLHESIHEDLSSLDSKLDNYQERLIKVESTLGFIKVGLAGAASLVGALITYMIHKFIDILSAK